jgi:hypothetical protein
MMMSRSGYSDDIDDQWQFIRWRGMVASTIRGKRGQAFLQEMLAAMDALPERKLVRDALEADGAVCAIGSVGRARGVDMSGIDSDDYERVAATFGISTPLAQEIMWMNDDAFWRDTPEARFEKMRKWIDGNIRKPKPLWFWAQ